MMFEKAKPFQTRSGVTSAERQVLLRASSGTGGEERPAPHPARRAGDALRALEWSELTARLNAARDLRLLLRTESHAPIEAVAASFGDAAASYFALLEDSEPAVNPDGLGQSKVPGRKVGASDGHPMVDARGPRPTARRGAARDEK